jgi:hypothetical protein
MIEDWIDPSREFDCPGCGRHITALGMLKLQTPLCGACLSIPGWYQHWQLVEQLDPENHRNRAAVVLTVVEIECRSVWIRRMMSWLLADVSFKEEVISLIKSTVNIDRGPPDQGWIH